MRKNRMKTPTWKELKKVVRDGELDAYLASVPEKQRPATALALSVAHWHRSERDWIWENENIAVSTDYCGLCTLYDPMSCWSCPLRQKAGECGKTEANPWGRVNAAIFYGERKAFDHYADKMFNILVELYEEEWAKL